MPTSDVHFRILNPTELDPILNWLFLGFGLVEEKLQVINLFNRAD